MGQPGGAQAVGLSAGQRRMAGMLGAVLRSLALSSYLGHHSPVGTGVLLPVWCVAQQVPGTSDGAHKEAFLWLTACEC